MICTFRHPFWVQGSGFIGQLLLDPDRVQPTQMCVSQLWLQISLVQRESRKNIISWVISCLRLQIFPPIFFPSFFKSEFFGISVFFDLPSGFLWLWYWFLANLVCIYPIKTGFGQIFHGFWPGARTQPFGPVPGPKSIFSCWYLKG